MTSLFIIKFGSVQMKIVGVAFWNFCSHRKKNRKNLKIEKKRKEKNCLEIWWIGWCPQNLAVSEKPECTDERTTDSCATTVALLTKSSRAKNGALVSVLVSAWNRALELRGTLHHSGEVSDQSLPARYGRLTRVSCLTTEKNNWLTLLVNDCSKVNQLIRPLKLSVILLSWTDWCNCQLSLHQLTLL